jgi:hypothetical protein
MTLRRLEADGNSAGRKSGLSDLSPRRALLTLRSAVILASGLAVAVITGILTYFPVRNLAEAVLAGLPACAGAIKFLDALID